MVAVGHSTAVVSSNDWQTPEVGHYTVVRNVVAVFLITPELSLERMEIYYLFKGKCCWNSRATGIFLLYFLVVGLAMGVIGGVMWCLIVLSTMFDVTYILLAIVINII